MNWQLNKIQYPVYNLGPGKRIGIWVQGCSLGCQGCVNRTLWRPEGGLSIPVLDVFNWLVSVSDGFDGVTISGGEPFQQYEQMISFLYLLRTRTALSVQCFTGYYLDELETMFPDGLYRRYTDRLVDGRYVRELHSDAGTKGSDNQTIYRFENGEAVRTEESGSSRWSLRVTGASEIYMAGIPKRGELQGICEDLRVAGIEKEFR